MKKTILVVDDNNMVRGSIMDVLHAEGYETLGANSGNKALEVLMLAIEKIDIVISDFNMPKMNGIEFLNAIRSNNDPKIQNILFLGMSVNKDNLKFFRKNKANGFCMKDPDELLEGIKKLLN